MSLISLFPVSLVSSLISVVHHSQLPADALAVYGAVLRISAGSNAYNQHKHMRTGGTGYSRPAPFHPPAAPVWGLHGYVGLAPPPSDPYGGSHVPPVPVPLPPPVPAPSSYVSVKVVSCSKWTQATVIETPNKKFVPKIRSGSDTAIRPRRCNEDEHILVDDLSAHLGSIYSCPKPSAFYAVFDGHGGSDAADYLKNNVMRILFEDADFPLASDIDDAFLKKASASSICWRLSCCSL